MSHHDVLIAGARCAGAATAMLLARRGLRVLVVDRARRGSDTLSTHALMRGAVTQLASWGLLERVTGAGTPAIRTTWFHYGDERVEIPIAAVGAVDALYAPRRTVLDPILVEAAEEAGAEVVFGARLGALLRGPGGRVRGARLAHHDGSVDEVSADLVIGADGLRSTVAALTGASTLHRGGHGSAVIYGHWDRLDLDGYHWCYRPGVSAGVIPTTGGQTCVFVAAPAARFAAELRHDVPGGYHRVLREVAPELAERVAGRRPTAGYRGFPGLPGYLRQAHGHGWALVGDAGFFRDPLSAHGMTDALRDAELLADAILAGELDRYQQARDRVAVPLLDLSDAMASFAWDLDRIKALHLDLSRAMKRAATAGLAPVAMAS
jgi:menaquinone-9 beta-reductase